MRRISAEAQRRNGATREFLRLAWAMEAGEKSMPVIALSGARAEAPATVKFF